MVSRVLKQQLEALKIVSAPIEFRRITDDMTLVQAMQVYSENINSMVSHRSKDASEYEDMTLEQATKIYNEQLKMTSHGAIK